MHALAIAALLLLPLLVWLPLWLAAGGVSVSTWTHHRPGDRGPTGAREAEEDDG